MQSNVNLYPSIKGKEKRAELLELDQMSVLLETRKISLQENFVDLSKIVLPFEKFCEQEINKQFIKKFQNPGLNSTQKELLKREVLNFKKK